jgi:6-phosphogluconolactonase
MTSSHSLPWDPRRVLHLCSDRETLVRHAAEDFVRVGNECIAEHGCFSVALSGGSTPLALYQLLASEVYAAALDWSRVHLFWGDERCVPPDSPDSNYGAAMRTGLDRLSIPAGQIHRIHAEEHIEANALAYDRLLREALPRGRLDLLLLGIGEDGHTASLFPHTRALHETQALCVANWVEQKETWRVTLTYPGIGLADRIWFLVTGPSKADILAEVLTDLSGQFPASCIGSGDHPATFMVDREAASLLPMRLDV